MSESDRTEYIAQTARQHGIELSDAEFARVKMIFANLERSALLLHDAELADDLVAAAVFRPGPGG